MGRWNVGARRAEDKHYLTTQVLICQGIRSEFARLRDAIITRRRFWISPPRCHELSLLRVFRRLTVAALTILLPQACQDFEDVCVRRHCVSQQPARDDGVSPADAAPAVDIGGPSGSQGLVDGVQDRSHRGTRRRGQVADRVSATRYVGAELFRVLPAPSRSCLCGPTRLATAQEFRLRPSKPRPTARRQRRSCRRRRRD